MGSLQGAGSGSRVTFQVDADALPLQEGALCRACLGPGRSAKAVGEEWAVCMCQLSPSPVPFSLQSQWGWREMDFGVVLYILTLRSGFRELLVSLFPAATLASASQPRLV